MTMEIKASPGIAATYKASDRYSLTPILVATCPGPFYVTFQCDTKRSVIDTAIHNINLQYDTKRTLQMKVRYTNKGVLDNILIKNGTVFTTEGEGVTKTGTCAAYGDSEIVAPTVLGLSENISEMWVRLDDYSYNNGRKIEIYFDGATGNNYMGLSGSTVYYGSNGGSSAGFSYLSGDFHTYVLQVNSTSVQLYIDGTKAIDKTGINNGTKITGVRLVSGNDRISNIIVANYDCSNETLAGGTETTVSIDTSRAVCASVTVNADTSRATEATVIQHLDTERILAAVTSTQVLADTARRIASVVTVHADTAVAVTVLDTALVDTARIVNSGSGNLVIVDCDTCRNTVLSVSVDADTSRAVLQETISYGDTARRIPTDIKDGSGAGIKSISISLAERTLADEVRIETVRPLKISDAVVGDLLDYHYAVQVESTTQQDLVQSVTTMYDVDKLLYTPFTYTAPDGGTASAHAQKIAASLGKSAEISIDDFRPSNNYAGTGATFQNIISGLFAWTSRLPRRQINVFIRGEKLYFLQRGKESAAVDISAYKHTRPQISRKIIRSVWSGNNGNSGATSQGGLTIEPIPFSGTIQFGDAANTYRNGLLVASSAAGTVTTYTYSRDYLIRRVETRTDGSKTETDYTYASTGVDRYLAEENEVTTDKKGAKTTRITRHQPIGHGWYGTTVYQDGEYQGSSLSQGKTGGKASKYTIDQSNISLGGSWGGGTGIHGGTSLIDTEFPVSDTETLSALTAEIEWMDRKTEESVSVDIAADVIAGKCVLQHVIDFTERIILDGNEYYLVSNDIKQSPTELRQSIKLVRWY